MDNDNVVSLATRQPYREEQASNRRERRSAGQRKRQEKNRAILDHREKLIEILDETKALVLAGNLEGLIIVGRNPKSKLFYTEMLLDETAVPRHDCFSYVGCLETLSTELKECAMMAPAMLADGSVIDPYVNQEVIYLEGEIDGDYDE